MKANAAPTVTTAQRNIRVLTGGVLVGVRAVVFGFTASFDATVIARPSTSATRHRDDRSILAILQHKRGGDTEA